MEDHRIGAVGGGGQLFGAFRKLRVDPAEATLHRRPALGENVRVGLLHPSSLSTARYPGSTTWRTVEGAGLALHEATAFARGSKADQRSRASEIEQVQLGPAQSLFEIYRQRKRIEPGACEIPETQSEPVWPSPLAREP